MSISPTTCSTWPRIASIRANATGRSPPRCCRSRSGIYAAGILLLCAALLAALIGPLYALVLACYYVVTWAYSLRLKRVALLDVMMLAGLYTLRIIAGSAATGIELSFWLLALSVFMFLSLGFVKRYAELDDARKAGKLVGHGRGYRAPMTLAADHEPRHCLGLLRDRRYCALYQQR